MQRHEAAHIFTTTFDTVRPKLLELVSGAALPTMNRLLIDRVADELQDSVERFAAGDDVDVHEDIYVPMFDALSYVRSARQLCGRFGIRVHLMRAVQTELFHALEELEGATSAAIPY